MRLELRRSRLPHPRGEGAEVVAIGHPRQPGEEILQVGQRVLAVALARDDEGIEDGRALAGVGVPDEQPVLLAHAGGADRVFDEIIVEPAFTVLQMGAEWRPLAEEVVAGFPEGRLGQHALPRPQGEALQAGGRPCEPLGLGPRFGSLRCKRPAGDRIGEKRETQ